MQGTITIEETTYEEVYKHFPNEKYKTFGSRLQQGYARLIISLIVALVFVFIATVSNLNLFWTSLSGGIAFLSSFKAFNITHQKEKKIYSTIIADKITIQSDYFIYDPGNFDKLPSLFIYNTHNNEETFFHLYGLYFSDMVEDGRLPNTEFTLYYDREPEVLIGIHCSGAYCAPAYIFPDTPEYNSDLFYTDRNFIPKDILIGMLKKEL
ncbi:MAG: hypothetical protein R2794_01645 [Chitinophagales bacterium]